jgi:hypothetical protein
MDFILSNWEWFLLAFYVAEKVVKQTTTKYDDIVLDVVWAGIMKIVGKK